MSNKLKKIKPKAEQIEFLNWEFGAFFHFGIRSFYLGHKDWDHREMPADVFNPESLDCEQWIKTVKEAGAKYAIFVAKHHDGFANWPSKYTEYSVANTPWRDGKGDIVREFVDACNKYSLKVGIYYSPAQWGCIDSDDEIDYDQYFINQITELLTNYGKVDYLWFDGNGSEGHEYDTKRIVGVIRSLQPNILIFNMWDPDTRWVGNEDGYANLPNFNTVSALDFSTNTTKQDILEEAMFLPAECDFMMRDTWFDCENNEDKIKTLDELVGIYEMSVGRGANFLINIGPNRHGLLPEPDVKRILEFGEEIRRRYDTPVEGFGEITPEKEKENEFFIERQGAELLNCVTLSEDLTDGESVIEYEIYGLLPLYRHDIVCLYRGKNIGHKAICRFPTVRTQKVILKIKDSNGEYKISDMKAYYIK